MNDWPPEMKSAADHDPLCHAAKLDYHDAECCDCELIDQVVRREHLEYEEMLKRERKTYSDINKAILRDYRLGLRDKLFTARSNTNNSLENTKNDFEFIIGNVSIAVMDAIIKLIDEDLEGGSK